MSSGRTQPRPPSSSSTASASTAANALRTAPLVEPSHHTRSSSVTGPNVHNSRRTIAAYPASGEVGVSSSPSQLAIDVHSGRDVRQTPSLWPRTTSPEAVSNVRRRVIVGSSVDHFVPGAAVNVPPRSGSAARSCFAESSSPVRRSTTRCEAVSIQSVPSSAASSAASLASRRRWASATRRPADPLTAGRRSRVTIQSVRRIAIVLTIERWSYSARSTSPTVSCAIRAWRDRYGVDDSVACSAVIAVVASSIVPYR